MALKRPPSEPSVSSLAGPSKKKSKNASSSQGKLDFFFRQHSTETTDSSGIAQSARNGDINGNTTAEGCGSPDSSIDTSHVDSKAPATDAEVTDAHKNGGNVEVDDDQMKLTSTSVSEISKSKTRSLAVKETPKLMLQGVTSSDSSKAAVSYPSLNVDALSYPISTSPWPQKKSAPYSFLAHALSSLVETRSRIAIINILTNTLRSLILHDPASLTAALYLLSNSLGPPYLAVELGLGPAIISKAIQQVSGLTSSALKKLHTKSGDAGDVAFEAKSNLRTLIPHAPLSILGVYNSLLSIAKTKGDGATKQKQSIVEKLLVAANGEEVRYLVRTLVQHIRVGAVRTTILIALARAMVLSKSGSNANPEFYVSLSDFQESSGKKNKLANDENLKEVLTSKFAKAESLIKRVFVQHPNYDDIVNALLEGGLEMLADKVPLTIGKHTISFNICILNSRIGIPLHPTLGLPTRSLDEIYDRLGDAPFTAELKYDGQRAQIHASRDENGKQLIKVFSRHLEDMTNKVSIFNWQILKLCEHKHSSRTSFIWLRVYLP